MSKGIIYKVTGETYIEEAKLSARSVKKTMPNLEVALVTDHDITNPDPFNIIVNSQDYGQNDRYKILTEDEIPFEFCLFLDSDTYVCRPIYELFEILEGYDIAVRMSGSKRTVPNQPTALREFNTGVYAFKNNPAVIDFFNTWSNKYKMWKVNRGITADQPSFAFTLYQSNLRYHALPEEYNCGPTMGYLSDDAKILHGRPVSKLPKFEKIINDYDKNNPKRVYNSNHRLLLDRRINMYQNRKVGADSPLYMRFANSAKKHGLKHAFQSTMSKIKSKSIF